MWRAAGVIVGVAAAACASRPAAGAASAPSSTATADSPSCEDLKYDREDLTTADAPTLCAHYRDELLPDVAMSAIRCMQSVGWGICDRSRCVTAALATASPEPDARCGEVEKGCAGMGEHCAAYISGMKPAGRDRFAACLVDGCGTGVRACLWDAMSTPCDAR